MARDKNLNQQRRAQAAQQKVRRAEQAVQVARARKNPPAKNSPGTSETHRAVVDTLRQAASVQEALNFGAVAKALGCSNELASALGHWHATALLCAPFPDVEVEDIQDFPEATIDNWRRTLGPVDQQVAEELYDKASVVGTTPITT